MIVDLLRNDMGRVARGRASVTWSDVFDLERYETVWQLTSTVSAEARAGVGPRRRVPGAVPVRLGHGCPQGAKRCEIIAELEDSPRGRRTAARSDTWRRPGRGRRRRDSTCRSARSIVDAETGTAEYGVGGGITWDSTRGHRVRGGRREGQRVDGPPAAVRARRDDPVSTRREGSRPSGSASGQAVGIGGLLRLRVRRGAVREALEPRRRRARGPARAGPGAHRPRGHARPWRPPLRFHRRPTVSGGARRRSTRSTPQTDAVPQDHPPAPVRSRPARGTPMPTTCCSTNDRGEITESDDRQRGGPAWTETWVTPPLDAGLLPGGRARGRARGGLAAGAGDPGRGPARAEALELLSDVRGRRTIALAG